MYGNVLARVLSKTINRCELVPVVFGNWTVVIGNSKVVFGDWDGYILKLVLGNWTVVYRKSMVVFGNLYSEAGSSSFRNMFVEREAYLYMCNFTYILYTYILHTYIQTYIHTYIHPRIHTIIHTNIYTYIRT